MKHALINRDLTDTGKRRNDLENPPGPGELNANKPYWVPVEIIEVNNATGPNTVTGLWVDEIVTTGAGPSAVAVKLTRTRTTRDMTPAEIATEDAGRADAAMSQSGMNRAIFQTLMDLENRIRNLEGNPSMNDGQFRAMMAQRIRG